MDRDAGHRRHGRGRSGFTLVELLIVIVLLAIAAGLALPMLGDSKQLQLREAARLLAADIEFARNESIAHGGDTRLMKFDTNNNLYWIAPASTPDTPITDVVRQEPFLVAFGAGRASSLSLVTIQSISLGGDDELGFDAYGSPDQSTTARVTLAAGAATLIVRVAPGSGEVTIVQPITATPTPIPETPMPAVPL